MVPEELRPWVKTSMKGCCSPKMFQKRFDYLLRRVGIRRKTIGTHCWTLLQRRVGQSKLRNSWQRLRLCFVMVGMVLTRNQYRRRGLARRLLAKVLLQADEMGIETLKLDATEQGRPLYEQFGFQCEQEIERWQRPGESAQLLPMVPHANDVWHSFDSVAFGADRSKLLKKLGQRHLPVSQAQSYLFVRQGRVTAHLGPCVSEDPITVRSLLRTSLQGTSCGWSWDLLPGNREAVAIACDLGFAPQRQLLRMARGKDLRGQDSAIYAVAGFELG
jgi:hypothetical protein